MNRLYLQPNNNSDASSGISPSLRHLGTHSTLLYSWAWYLSTKWRICISSRSSQIWILSFLELLLAVPDLFAILESTILLTSTPMSSHSGSRSTITTIPPDATVHVLITCVPSAIASNINTKTSTCTDELDQNMRRTHRHRHGNRESRSIPNLPCPVLSSLRIRRRSKQQSPRSDRTTRPRLASH